MKTHTDNAEPRWVAWRRVAFIGVAACVISPLIPAPLDHPLLAAGLLLVLVGAVVGGWRRLTDARPRAASPPR